MAARAVHWRPRGGAAICGAGARWQSCDITSVLNQDAVTCRSCRRILDARGRTGG